MECQWVEVDVCSKCCFVSTWINFQEKLTQICHQHIFLCKKSKLYNHNSSTKLEHNIKFRFLLLSAPFECSECHRNFYHLTTKYFFLFAYATIVNEWCRWLFAHVFSFITADCKWWLRRFPARLLPLGFAGRQSGYRSWMENVKLTFYWNVICSQSRSYGDVLWTHIKLCNKRRWQAVDVNGIDRKAHHENRSINYSEWSEGDKLDVNRRSISFNHSFLRFPRRWNLQTLAINLLIHIIDHERDATDGMKETRKWSN